jgi:hypothetical protein
MLVMLAGLTAALMSSSAACAPPLSCASDGVPVDEDNRGRCELEAVLLLLLLRDTAGGHTSYSTAEPVQLAPPSVGNGLLHARVRFREAPLLEEEHDDQSLQTAHKHTSRHIRCQLQMH